MANKKDKFIITTSAESADWLIKKGFNLVQQQDGRWVFLNNGRLVFSNLEKVSFSNILYM